MKLFQTAQKNLLLVKFNPNQTDSFFGLMRQHSSCFFQAIMTILSLALYLLLDANSMIEYLNSMFLITLGVIIFVSFWSSVLKTPELYAFVASCEMGANESELIKWRDWAIYIKFWANFRNKISAKIAESAGRKQPTRWAVKQNCIFVDRENWAIRTVIAVRDCQLLSLLFHQLWKWYIYAGRPSLVMKEFLCINRNALTHALSYKSRFPFDWKTPKGYGLAVILQFIMYLNPLRFIACYLSIAVGSFLFLHFFVKGIFCVPSPVKAQKKTFNDFCYRWNQRSTIT